MNTTASQRRLDWDASPGKGIVIPVVLLHLAAVWGLLQMQSVRQAIVEAAPIMVGLITPEVPKVEPPPPEPPKPKIEKAKPRMIVSEAPPTASAIVVEKQPEPEPVEDTPPPPPQAEVVASAPPIVPPSFDAAYLKNPAPSYPAMSKKLREQGRVMLRVLVDATGHSKKVELERSSGSNRLDDAALEAVGKWSFEPARQGDQAIEAWVLVPIDFALN